MRVLHGKGSLAALGLLVAGAFVLRPLAYGVSAGAVAFAWALVLFAAALPGAAVLRAAGLYRSDAGLLAGQALTLGLALHGLAFLGGRALGTGSPTPLLVVLGLVGAAWAFRHGLAQQPAVRSSAAGALCVVLLGALLQPLVTLRLLGDPVPVDLLYHAGNAAELLHRWPLEDPRAAGLPLNYPVLAYALPVELGAVAGLPVSDAVFGLFSMFWIALLALQTWNLGRVLLGDATGAVLGCAVLLLHEDIGGLLGLGRGAFLSTLATGLYGSPTTVCGLVLLTGMSLVVAELLTGPERRRALLGLLAFFGVAASLTKATVVPAVAGGAAVLFAWELCRRRWDTARTALACALVLGLAALPFTLRLGTGDASYRGILRFDPGAVIRQSPFAAWVARGFGLADAEALPSWLVALASPVWLLGHLGLAGAGALAFVLWRRGSLGPSERFALSVCVAGAVPALLFDAHGISQLFFLYNGQLLLAVLAGGALSRALRRPVPVALLAALGVVALPSLEKGARFLLAQPSHDLATAARATSGTVADYAAGLAWLRANGSRGAVVFADNPSLLLSALGECRLYYETGLYTPRGWERRWQGATEPYPERAAFQEALLRRASPDTIAQARRLFPGSDLLVVADSVQSRIESGFLAVEIGPVPRRALLPPPFRPEFANEAMHVYRLAGAPGS